MGTLAAHAADELRVVLEPRPAGSRATYIIKTNTPQELDGVRQFFMGLSELMTVRPLADGPASAYAVEHFQPHPSAYSEIEGLLRRYFEQVVCEHSVDGAVLDLVHTLCSDTGSRELEIERCGICGSPQPFPTTVVTITNSDGGWTRRRVYCTPCIANVSAVRNCDLVRALLISDSEHPEWARRAELIEEESTSLRGGRVAFRLRPAA
jgi:hypothetical protein